MIKTALLSSDATQAKLTRRVCLLQAVVAVWGVWGATGPWGHAYAADNGQAQRLPIIALSAGMHRIAAEVAQSPEQRAIGLMHRRDMPQHAGMLFVFEAPGIQCFWMKNTLLPLSIAFLRDDGSIINIAEMKPQSLDSHCAAEPARYALEMNTGWFSKRGLGPGQRISGGPFASRPP